LRTALAKTAHLSGAGVLALLGTLQNPRWCESAKYYLLVVSNLQPFSVGSDEPADAAMIPARGFTMDEAHTYGNVDQEWHDLFGDSSNLNKQRPVSIHKRLQVFFANGIYNLLNFAGYCVALCGGMVVLFQCLLWLRDGVWTKLELRTGLQAVGISEPTLDRVADQKILSWALDLPISGSLVVLGLLLVAMAVAYLEPLILNSRR
jgi:hypothetical protein